MLRPKLGNEPELQNVNISENMDKTPKHEFNMVSAPATKTFSTTKFADHITDYHQPFSFLVDCYLCKIWHPVLLTCTWTLRYSSIHILVNLHIPYPDFILLFCVETRNRWKRTCSFVSPLSCSTQLSLVPRFGVLLYWSGFPSFYLPDRLSGL